MNRAFSKIVLVVIAVVMIATFLLGALYQPSRFVNSAPSTSTQVITRPVQPASNSSLFNSNSSSLENTSVQGSMISQ